MKELNESKYILMRIAVKPKKQMDVHCVGLSFNISVCVDLIII